MSVVTSKLKKACCNPLVRRLPSSSLRSLRSEHAKDLDLVGSEIHEKENESTPASQEVKSNWCPVVSPTPTTGAASILPHRAHLKSDFLSDTFINSNRR